MARNQFKYPDKALSLEGRKEYALCENENCRLKNHCHRFLSRKHGHPGNWWMAWFGSEDKEVKNECRYFLDKDLSEPKKYISDCHETKMKTLKHSRRVYEKLYLNSGCKAAEKAQGETNEPN